MYFRWLIAEFMKRVLKLKISHTACSQAHSSLPTAASYHPQCCKRFSENVAVFNDSHSALIENHATHRVLMAAPNL